MGTHEYFNNRGHSGYPRGYGADRGIIFIQRVGFFFFPKMPSIFNTNNTCNKYIRINLNIKKKCNKHNMNIYFFLYHLKNVTN